MAASHFVRERNAIFALPISLQLEQARVQYCIQTGQISQRFKSNKIVKAITEGTRESEGVTEEERERERERPEEQYRDHFTSTLSLVFFFFSCLVDGFEEFETGHRGEQASHLSEPGLSKYHLHTHTHTLPH